jgi:hypothetical protein
VEVNQFMQRMVDQLAFGLLAAEFHGFFDELVVEDDVRAHTHGMSYSYTLSRKVVGIYWVRIRCKLNLDFSDSHKFDRSTCVVLCGPGCFLQVQQEPFLAVPVLEVPDKHSSDRFDVLFF